MGGMYFKWILEFQPKIRSDVHFANWNTMTYGGWGEFHEAESSQGKRIVTLMHTLGQNGSIYLSNFVKALFEVINVEPKISTTDQAVVIEIQS